LATQFLSSTTLSRKWTREIKMYMRSPSYRRENKGCESNWYQTYSNCDVPFLIQTSRVFWVFIFYFFLLNN
jgi:hypothetical protein